LPLAQDHSSTPDLLLEGKHGCRYAVLGGPGSILINQERRKDTNFESLHSMGLTFMGFLFDGLDR
jgi:hypothetical protein